MDPAEEILKDIPGLVRVYKDGRIQRFITSDVVPAGIDPSSGIQSKDVVISPETKVSVRIYLPKTTTTPHKLPLLIFYHGGGFITETPASPIYHSFLNLIVAESNVVAVSVDYRRAPEHYLPVGYEDAWEAIKWVTQHIGGSGFEPWLNDHADFQNVFIAGDSAGGNIAHHVAIRVGSENLGGRISVQGLILLHPYFWGEERIGSESGENPWKALMSDMWIFSKPETSGLDDPFINPGMDPNVLNMGCSRILVFVGGADLLKDRGWYYKEVMGKSGWKGQVEVVEDEGEGHCYFLEKPSADNACALRTRICTFINSNLFHF